MGLYSLFPRISTRLEPLNIPDPVPENGSKPFVQNGQTSPANEAPRGSVTPSTSSTMANLKFKMMTSFLHQEQLKLKWVKNSDLGREGCFIRKGPASYVTYPPPLAESGSALATAIAALIPQARVVKLCIECSKLICLVCNDGRFWHH